MGRRLNKSKSSTDNDCATVKRPVGRPKKSTNVSTNKVCGMLPNVRRSPRTSNLLVVQNNKLPAHSLVSENDPMRTCDDFPQTPICSKKCKTKKIEHLVDQDDDVLKRNQSKHNDVAVNLFKFVQEDDFSPIRHLKSNYLVNNFEDEDNIVVAFGNSKDLPQVSNERSDSLHAKEEEKDVKKQKVNIDFKQLLSQFDFELQNCSVSSTNQLAGTPKTPSSPSLISSQAGWCDDISNTDLSEVIQISKDTSLTTPPIKYHKKFNSRLLTQYIDHKQSTPILENQLKHLNRTNLSNSNCSDELLFDTEFDLMMSTITDEELIKHETCTKPFTMHLKCASPFAKRQMISYKQIVTLLERNRKSVKRPQFN